MKGSTAGSATTGPGAVTTITSDAIGWKCARKCTDDFTATGDVRKNELALEREVSQFIGNMPFLWLRINDDAGPDSWRGYIERNSIALLSNYEKPPLDPPSPEWLGHKSDRARVRASGLWNQNHVDESYAPEVLDRLEQMVAGCAT